MATDPRKKILGEPDMMPTAIVRPGAAPQVGGVPAFVNPVTSAMSSASAPARLQPGQAAPDVNPQAMGTRLGNTLRDARRGVVNDQVATLNTLSSRGAGLTNAATFLPRAALGFTRDTTRAALGMDPSPNAGQPIGGLPAPQPIATPYIKPPVNFALTHSDVPVRNPMASGGAGGAPATASPAATAAVASAAQPQNSVSVAPGANVASSTTPGPDFSRVGGSVIRSPGAQVEGGRTLPVGAMIDGVPTFSDGSGRAGIPRTMDDATIKSYGDHLSRADAGALGNVLAGDVAGAGTVTQDQMVDQRVAQIQRPITGSRPSAEQFAAADRNAIALRDPRSAAGSAARSLEMEAQYGRGGARRAAVQGLQDLTAGANAAGLTAQQGENAQALTETQGQNAMDQVMLQGQNQLANTALETAGRLRMPRAGQQVTLADGTLGLQDSMTGAITRSTLPDGSVAKGQPRNPPAPIYTSAGGAASLQALTNNILGINPNTGMIDDKAAPGGSRLPTNEEQFAAMQKAQQQLESLGGGGAAKPAGPKAGVVEGGYRFKGGDPSNQANWEKV